MKLRTAASKARRNVLQAAEFKAHALAVMRRVHDTGEPVTVTSHGRPIVMITPLRQSDEPVGYGCMRGTFELLGAAKRARVVDASAWESLREWDEEIGR